MVRDDSGKRLTCTVSTERPAFTISTDRLLHVRGTHRHTDRQTDRQRDRQAYRHRQTDRQAWGATDREH